MRLENFLIPFENKDCINIYLSDKSGNVRTITMTDAVLNYGNVNIIRAYFMPEMIMQTNVMLTVEVDKWEL